MPSMIPKLPKSGGVGKKVGTGGKFGGAFRKKLTGGSGTQSPALARLGNKKSTLGQVTGTQPQPRMTFGGRQRVAPTGVVGNPMGGGATGNVWRGNVVDPVTGQMVPQAGMPQHAIGPTAQPRPAPNPNTPYPRPPMRPGTRPRPGYASGIGIPGKKMPAAPTQADYDLVAKGSPSNKMPGQSLVDYIKAKNRIDTERGKKGLKGTSYDHKVMAEHKKLQDAKKAKAKAPAAAAAKKEQELNPYRPATFAEKMAMAAGRNRNQAGNTQRGGGVPFTLAEVRAKAKKKAYLAKNQAGTKYTTAKKKK